MSSPIIIIMGRPTTDPVIRKAQNNPQIEYVSLNIATTQRGKNGENETVYISCFFNKNQAHRLIKAGVKHGTCLQVYGELSFHPYIHEKGKKAGQPDVEANLMVQNWQFTLSNRPENETGIPKNGAPAGNYSGPATPGSGGYQSQNVPNQTAPNQPIPNGNYGGASGIPNQTPPQNGAGYQNPPAAYAGGGYPPQNGAPQNYQAAPAGNGYGNNDFSNVPESQLPFPA